MKLKQKDTLWHYLFIAAYTLLIAAFLIWTFRYYNRISKPDRTMFYFFWSLPVIGLIIEILSLKREQYEDPAAAEEKGAETSAVDRENRRQMTTLLMRIIIPLILVLTQHIARSTKTAADDPESKIPLLPTTPESYSYDAIERHRADSSSDRRVSDLPEHESTDDWMEGLTILPQVLYEDDLFTYEITKCRIDQNYIVIKTRFSNRSDHRIKVENVSDHEMINHVKGNPFYVNATIPSGETQEDNLQVWDFDVPWFDTSLRELELILRVSDADADEEDVDSGQALLLETPPLIIRTKPVEGATTREGLLTDDEIRVLYESDEVRVIRTGILDCLFIKDGKPTFISSTYWEILIENMSQGDVVIRNAACTANGRNALLDASDSEKVWETVPAGKRDAVRFSLIGEKPDDDVLKTVTSYAELAGALRLPLEDIETSGLSFELNYIDASGTPISVRIDDAYRCFDAVDHEGSR